MLRYKNESKNLLFHSSIELRETRNNNAVNKPNRGEISSDSQKKPKRLYLFKDINDGCSYVFTKIYAFVENRGRKKKDEFFFPLFPGKKQRGNDRNGRMFRRERRRKVMFLDLCVDSPSSFLPHLSPSFIGARFIVLLGLRAHGEE